MKRLLLVLLIIGAFSIAGASVYEAVRNTTSEAVRNTTSETADYTGTYWSTAYGTMWTEAYATDSRWSETYNTEYP